MADKRNLEMRKDKVNEIGKRIDEKSERAKQLENAKTEARNARMEIENMDKLDDDAKNEGIKATNEAYEQASKEAKEVSEKLGEDISELEELRQETSDSLDAANEAKNREEELAKACEANGIIYPKSHSMDDNISGNNALLEEIIQKMQDADKIASKLSGIGKRI